MATLQQHHIKAIIPSWLFVKKVAPAPPRDGAKKPAPAAASSPLFLSPAVWQKARDEKKSKDAGRDGGLPASPRISCMGQVKGRSRRRECSSARDPRATSRRSGHGRGVLATLALGLFGRRNGRTSKVRDVPRGSASAPGSSHGGGSVTAAAVGVLDPPLPVVRRPARSDDAPSLWERRRGGGKALEGLRLTA